MSAAPRTTITSSGATAARAYPLLGVKKDDLHKALGYFENNAPSKTSSASVLVGAGVAVHHDGSEHA